MEIPKVSIIIPTYKGYRFLERAILSAKIQTYKNIEVIVVDDNGLNTIESNKTKSVVSKYSDIVYIQHKINSNGAVARNSGLDIARGKYICFLDDDDLMLPNRIELCVKKLEYDFTYDGVFCDVLITDQSLYPNRIIKIEKTGNCTREILMNDLFIGTGSNLFLTRKSCLELGGFNTLYTRHQDLEFLLRFYRRYKTACISEILVIKSKNGINNIPNIEKLKRVKYLFENDFFEEIQSLSNKNKKIYFSKKKKLLLLSDAKNTDFYQAIKVLNCKEILLFSYLKFGLEKYSFIQKIKRIKYFFIKNKIPTHVSQYLSYMKNRFQ